MFRGFRPTFSRQTVGFAVTSPGVKLLSVRMKASVEMISDKIFCFNFSGAIFRYIVPIHHHVHQQSDAAAHGDRMEGEKKPKFGPFHPEKSLQQPRKVAQQRARLPAG